MRKKHLACFLAVLLALLPCASFADGDALSLSWRLTLEREELEPLMQALVGTEATNAELSAALDVADALADAAELELSLWESGAQATLLLSDTEILSVRAEAAEESLYITSSILPDIALSIAYADTAELFSALMYADWEALGDALEGDAAEWLGSLSPEKTEGAFFGATYSGACARFSFSVDDRDLSVLGDSWLNRLAKSTDAERFIDALLGEGTLQGLLSYLREFNHQVALENRDTYAVKLYTDAGGNSLGMLLSGGEAANTPWTLSAGWQDDGLDLLFTPLGEGNPTWLRYTLTAEEDLEGRETQQRFHVLSGAENASYDEAAEAPEEELLLEVTVREGNQGTISAFESEGILRYMLYDLEITLRSSSLEQMDWSTLHGEGTTQYYMGGLGVAERRIASTFTQVSLVEAPDTIDYAALQILECGKEAMGSETVSEALEKGLITLTVRLFKALPPACIQTFSELFSEMESMD